MRFATPLTPPPNSQRLMTNAAPKALQVAGGGYLLNQVGGGISAGAGYGVFGKTGGPARVTNLGTITGGGGAAGGTLVGAGVSLASGSLSNSGRIAGGTGAVAGVELG